MATVKQLEANRLNAKKSTGPRSAEGRSASRLNALKHGLFATDLVIPSEDPARYQALRDSYQERFQPATPEEHTLLASIVRNAWYLERYSNVETEIWSHEVEFNAKHHGKSDRPLVRAQFGLAKHLAHIQQRLNAAERHFRRDLELLNKLQATRQKAQSQPNPIEQPKPNQPLTPEIGFVPSTFNQPPAVLPLAVGKAAVAVQRGGPGSLDAHGARHQQNAADRGGACL